MTVNYNPVHNIVVDGNYNDVNISQKNIRKKEKDFICDGTGMIVMIAMMMLTT